MVEMLDLFGRLVRRIPMPHVGAQNVPLEERSFSTFTSLIFVTMSATFQGPTASFVTQTIESKPSTAVGIPQTATTPTAAPITTHTTSQTTPTTPTTSAATTTATSSTQNHQTFTVTMTSNTRPHHTGTISTAVGNPVQATSEPSSTASSSSSSYSSPSSSSGTSGAAKAAAGVITVVFLALIAVAIFFYIKRKKQRRSHQEIESHDLDNEKLAPRSDNSRAPRLSLRPVTQFLPSFPKVSEMNNGNSLSPTKQPPLPQQNRSNWNQPRLDAVTETTNPFGNHAEAKDPMAAERAAENAPIPVSSTSPTHAQRPRPQAASPAGNPFADSQPASRTISPEDPRPMAPMGSGPRPGHGPVAGPIAGPPPPGPPSNVHRVQLDFKPSMDDELELRAGQLVRMRHEYDDGWVS